MHDAPHHTRRQRIFYYTDEQREWQIWWTDKNENRIYNSEKENQNENCPLAPLLTHSLTHSLARDAPVKIERNPLHFCHMNSNYICWCFRASKAIKNNLFIVYIVFYFHLFLQFSSFRFYFVRLVWSDRTSGTK